VNWDNFRKVVMLVLILWAAVSAVLCIIYFFILGGRSPAPANIFRALILAAPCLQSGGGGRPGQMISARPITVLLRTPTAFGGLCERGTLSDRVTAHWLAHGFCNLSMSYESCESTGLV
jgi:hypothetical protein